MTTIAANRHCMAADRKVTDGDTRYYSKKIKRVGKAIVGCAGTAALCNQFFVWFKTRRDKDKPVIKDADEDTLDAIVLTDEGRLFVYDKDCQVDELEDDYYAVGTGRQAALAAMFLGADPARAVQVAREIDNDTGGQIDVLETMKNVA